MIAALGAANLSPLIDPNGNLVYANGTQVYMDSTGAIVDSSDNSVDPLNGDLYQDEISGSYSVQGGSASSAASPPANSNPQSPKGTKLIYAASWNPPSFGGTLISLYPQQVAQQLSAQLGAYGLQVTASTYNSPSVFSSGSVATIQLSITDTIGHNLFTDAQSVVDSLLKSAIGSSNFISSNLAPVGLAQPGLGPQPTPSQPSGGSDSNWFAKLFSGSSSGGSQPKSSIPTWEWGAIAGVGLVLVIVITIAVSRR